MTQHVCLFVFSSALFVFSKFLFNFALLESTALLLLCSFVYDYDLMLTINMLFS